MSDLRKRAFRLLADSATKQFSARASKAGTRATRQVIEVLRAGVGAFLGIAGVAMMAQTLPIAADRLFLIGSFGATAVLLYAAPQAAFSQPRNVLGGHLLSAFIGVTVAQFLGSPAWLSAASAVALSVMAMQLTRTIHPPGGATALIAVIGSDKVKELGYGYLLTPVLAGVLVMLGVAYLTNNFATSKRYPASPE